MDRDLIFTKSGLVQKHLKRIEMKIGDDQDAFLKDPDKQDIVAYNFHIDWQDTVHSIQHPQFIRRNQRFNEGPHERTDRHS